MNAEMQNEVFLGENVGSYESYPKPLTTDEYYLEKMYRLIKENGRGGGNNDFVVNYLIETDAETGEPNIVCDKTAAEIYEAYVAGKNVKALISELGATPIPIMVASQEDGLYVVEFGFVTWAVETQFTGVLHTDNSGAIHIQVFQDTLVNNVTLDNRLETLAANLNPADIVYIDNGNNIEVQDEDAILSLLQRISERKNVRGVFEPNGAEPYLVLNIQSFNNVYNSSDQTETHTVIFSNVLPTATGIKCVFITQSATTNSTIEELLSHTETYEEKILSVQAP